mgnify:CR=1 FL=1
MSSLPEKNDILFAHVAINLAPDLSGTARRVAAAIIGHFNRKTGQCDPSVSRLAELLGINRATVLRATAELCSGPDRLFDKRSHAGKGHRAKYMPRWDLFQAIVSDWNARMKTGAAPEKSSPKVAKLRRSRSQSCDVKGRSSATQTYLRNLSKEPEGAKSRKPAPAESPVGLMKKKPRREAQGYLIHALPGGKQRSHREAAFAAAERRLNDQIRKGRSAVRDALFATASAEAWQSAAHAEMDRRGAGLAVLMEAARLEADAAPNRRAAR